MSRLALPALLLALGCNPGFDPQYRVTDLRILAVHAEVAGSADASGVTTADPNLTQSLQLEALVANPQNRTLRVRWFACAPSTTGDLPPCLDPAFLRDPSSLAAAGAYEVPGPPPPATGEQPPPIALSSLPPPVVAALQQALQDRRNLALSQPTYQCLIYVEIPLVVIAQADGLQDVALKRVRIVQTPPAPTPPDDWYVVNSNPVIDDAYRAPVDETTCTGGTSIAPPTAFPAGRTTLCARENPVSPRNYNVCDAAGNPTSVDESDSWQWYVTAGEFPKVGGLGNAEGSHLEFDRPSRPFTLWLILRDGRGGDVWKRFDIGPAP